MKKTMTILLSFIMVLLLGTFVYAGNFTMNVFNNTSGQRVIQVTGDSSLTIYARGNNVWNATYGWGISDCKGPDYVTVAQSNGQLSILYVNTSGKYRRTWASQNYVTDVIVNGVSKTWNGEVLNTVTGAYQQSTQQYTQPNYNTPNYQYNNGGYNYDYGYNNGYNYGYYDYGYNYNYNYDDYYYDRNRSRYDVYVEKSGKTWKYYDGSKTYTYTLKSGQLDYGNYEIADDVDAIGFIEDYLIYIVDDDEIWATKVGKKDEGEQIGDGFEKITYESGTNLIDYIKVDGKKYDADDIEDAIKDDGFDKDDDDDDDDDYPYVKKSGQKYTYYKSKSSKYVYTFENGSVEYKNDEILDVVDTVGFSKKGYIFMLTSDGDLYRLKVGSNSSPSWIDGGISYITVNSDYIVTKIVFDDGHSLKTSDYE
jgi:hypothetical protein